MTQAARGEYINETECVSFSRRLMKTCRFFIIMTTILHANQIAIKTT